MDLLNLWRGSSCFFFVLVLVLVLETKDQFEDEDEDEGMLTVSGQPQKVLQCRL